MVTSLNSIMCSKLRRLLKVATHFAGKSVVSMVKVIK